MARKLLLHEKPDIFSAGYPELYVTDILNIADLSNRWLCQVPGRYLKFLKWRLSCLSWLEELDIINWSMLDKFVKNMVIVREWSQTGTIYKMLIEPEMRIWVKM